MSTAMDINKLTQDYLEATHDNRQLIRSSFNEKTSWNLLLYSKTLAVEAVRQKNYDLVKKGLILHSIENARTDWRDNIVRLSLLYNSGKKLGENPNTLFEEIANISDTKIKDILLSFVKRKEKDKSILIMGYNEINEPDFDYIKT